MKDSMTSASFSNKNVTFIIVGLGNVASASFIATIPSMGVVSERDVDLLSAFAR